MNFSKKVLASLLAATSIAGPLSASADTAAGNEAPFKDLDKAATWSRDSILQAKLLGLFEGDAQGNFRPGDQITRQEMAKILVQLLKLPLETTTASSFADVDSKAWSAAYIEAALKAGIMQGYGNGKFDPQAVMTREQLAIVIVKALGLPLENDTTSLSRFEDAANIHDWSARYVAAALKAGLMTGSGSTFGATATANRQEAAMVAVRVHTQKQQAAQTGSGDGASTTPVTSASTGTPTVPGTVVPNGTTTPPVVTPSNPAPSSGSGSTTPVTPPVTTPVTPPAEQSLPAVATTGTINVLNYSDTQATQATVTSQKFTNLNFGIVPIVPASATSNTITNISLSGSNVRLFQISDGEKIATILLQGTYANLGEIVASINQTLSSSKVEASAVLDTNGSTFTVTRTSLTHNGVLKLGGPDIAEFFAKTSYDAGTVDLSKQVKFSLNDGQTITLDLNKNYASLTEVITSWNSQLSGIQADASAVLDETQPLTITLRSEYSGSNQKIAILEESAAGIFAKGEYRGKDADFRSKSFRVSDGVSDTKVKLNDSYASIEALAKAIDDQLQNGVVQATAELASPYTIKITSKALGKQAKLKIDGGDAGFFFDQELFEGSGPSIDQAPTLKGVPIRSQADQSFWNQALTPSSSDTDIKSVQLVRSTDFGLDYAVTDYKHPVTGYTLGSPISEEGSYRLIVKDEAGQSTETYFSIEDRRPAFVLITSEQNANVFDYDQGDKLTFTLNNFVLKHDSQDGPMDPQFRGISIASLEKGLNRLTNHSPYTLGQGATLTTKEVMPDHPSYGRIFMITLGSGAIIPSTGAELNPETGDMLSPSGAYPWFSSGSNIPALVE